MKHVIRLGLIVAVAAAGRAGAQCDMWMGGPFQVIHPGSDGVVSAATTWDPDGAGPQPANLVVGGAFAAIEGIAATRVAAWNGAYWAPLGQGLPGQVYALAVYNGDLVAAGSFPQVYRWHLGAWIPLGGPLGGTGTPHARALAVYSGQLIVAGDFDSAGGVSVNNIARLSGTSGWSALGAGLLGTSNPEGRSLAVYNNELIAGGTFDLAGTVIARNIARWNGAAWQPLGQGIIGVGVRALAVQNSALFAGGDFHTAGGVTASHIARWNGSAWQPLAQASGQGILQAPCGGPGGPVRALASHNNFGLMVGGNFWLAGGVGVSSIARWDDPSSTWQGFGGLAGGTCPTADALAAHNGQLVVGGNFQTAGGLPANNLARWGSLWGVFTTPTVVNSFAPLGSRMIAGGAFAQPTGPSTPAAYNVGAWDGVSIKPLGQGFNAAAFALKSFTHPGPLGDDELVAGGGFTVAGGVAANRIARWVENPLIAFPPPAWEPMGAGFNNTVYALERFDGTSVVAAGSFTASGATTVNRIALWNGTAWQPMGAGLNDTVYALRYGSGPLNIEMLVGGSFTTAGGAAANRIARWIVNPLLPGSGSWAAMGAGFNAPVRAIERYNNATYAAGDFIASGTTPLNRIARWTGSAWVDVGGGLNGPVYALKSAGGFLYAAGAAFPERVARWNGTAWAPVGDGADSLVFALGVFHDEVHAGGAFTVVGNLGGGLVVSPGWARYTPDGHPWVVTHPFSQQRECGQDATFAARVAQGYGPVAHQWRRNGAPLSNGPTGTGSTISGASGLTTAGTPVALSIQNLSVTDAGAYDCVFSVTCGQVATSAATLTLTDCCYPDCNNDNALTVADFGCFQTKFVAQDPYADCNTDSQFTVADFGCFQTSFVAGCP